MEHGIQQNGHLKQWLEKVGFKTSDVNKDFQEVISSIKSNKPVNILYDTGESAHWCVIKSVQQNVKTQAYRINLMNPSGIGYRNMESFGNVYTMFNVTR